MHTCSRQLASLGLAFLLIGCRGGPAGARGPDGEDGATGVDGADGATGPDGADGADGNDGEDGADGADGRDGHDGEAPWGVHLELLSVGGGSGSSGQLLPGDLPVVTFSVTDDDGVAYDLGTLSGLGLQLSGPVDHFQIAVDDGDLTDTRTASVWNADGTYTYTFLAPVPDVYDPVPNDTPDLGEAEGDWGGLPLEDGTYRIAAWAYVRIDREDGSYWYDADNAVQDVLVGDATALESREVVLQEDCASCHGEVFYAHGGSRRDIAVCESCHVAGAEDRYSATDAGTTPGATIAWDVMIHKIHMGEALTDGVRLNGYPAEADVEGYPDYNVHDWSDVVFPRFPMGPATCEACHGGAPDGDVYANPTRAACQACHDTVDTTTGANHDGGVVADDGLCVLCHTSASLEAAHADPRSDPTVNPGFVVTLTDVGGGSGPEGQLLPGDAVRVSFQVAEDDGTLLANTAVSSATLVLSGPLDHMQEVFKDTSWIASGSANTTLTTDGAGTYTATFHLPSTYAAQENDTDAFGVEDGDWGGLDLVSGTYRVGLNVYRSVTGPDGVSSRTPASATLDVLVGEDTTTVATRDVVDPESCLGCHGLLEFHGQGRTGYEMCVTCHTAGAEDRYSATDGSVTPGVTIDWPVLIHKIHAGAGLSQPYEVAGYSATSSYTLSTFEDVRFPRQDGGVEACVACHEGSDAYQDPQTTACLACHDSPDTAAHAAANTDERYGESCDVCHGPGRAFEVSVVHDWLK